MDPNDKNFLIVRAVENADTATLGQRARGAPQKIMVQLLEARMLETEHLATLRIDTGHYMFDRAVLAGGIHRLKDQQHGITVGGVEEILQFAHLFDVGPQHFFQLFL